jgi:autotransporter-associated beta strand protein
VNLALGYYDTSSSFSGVIQNSGSALTLTKVGAGTLTLSGANTYTGSTIITNGGMLALTGSIISSGVNILSSGTLALSGSATVGATNINIGAAATLNSSGLASGFTISSGQTLAGNGTVQGNLSTSTGAIIAPGGNNVAGTLTVNGTLTLSGSGFLDYDVTASNSMIGGGINDLLLVNGNLTLNAGTVVNVNALGGGIPTGVTYTLMQYTGTLTGNPATTLSANFGSHYTVTFANNSASSPKSITMTISGSPQNLTWSGASSFAWDESTLNWSNNATHLADSFSAGDTVTFNNFGNSSSPINFALAVEPNTTTVSNSSTYTFGTTASGSLGGGALTKSGTGTLILDLPGTYVSTFINGGLLQVGNGDGTATLGTGLVADNGTLAFDLTNATTVTNAISGSGGVTQSGTGDLTLSTSNTFTGPMTVNSGRVLVQNPNGMGNGSAVVNGGQIYVTLGSPASYNLSSAAMTLNGSGPNNDGTGALRKGGSTTTGFGGPVTFGSDTTLSVDGGATLNLTNASGLNGASVNANITLAGTGAGNFTGPMSLGSGNLTVSGGTWTVAPSNNFSGQTTISGGALLMTGPLSVGPVPASFNSSQVTLSGGSLGAASNVVLNDGNIGISVSDNSTASGIEVSSTNATFVISNQISGDSSTALTKSGPGTLVLSGPNPFGGTLNIDSASITANDGTTVINNNAAIANILAVEGFPYIFIRDNNGGSSTLALDGSLNSITVAPDIALSGRNVAVPAIENLAGSNTISGNFTLNVGGSFYIIQSDSGTLALTASPIPYATTTNSGRVFTFQGAGAISVPGGIQDGSANPVGTNVWMSVVKTGTGLLNLSAANTYSGPTVVSNGVLSLTGSLETNTVTVAGGLLVGNGTINGPVVVQGGAIEAGTTNAIGVLTLSGSASTLTLAGNTIVKINKSTGARDQFNGQTSVAYGGTLTVTNLAGTLALGNSFTLFTPGASASNFSSIVGSPGAGLAYSFTNGVLSVVTAPVFTPTNITFSLSGNSLTLSWPANPTGWILQSQTNSLGSGLGTNWVDVAGSGSVTEEVYTVNPSSPTVFYRLRSQ